MKQFIGILSLSLILATALCPAMRAAEPVTPEAAAQSPSLLRTLVQGQNAEDAVGAVTATVDAAKALGLSAEATSEMLALISAAAIASSGPDTAGPIAAALVQSAGSNNTATVVAAIVLAAGTEPWAGQSIGAALQTADESTRAAAEEAVRDPVKTLGEALAAEVVRLAARIRKATAGDDAEGDTTTQGAANAGRFEAPVSATKYKGQ